MPTVLGLPFSSPASGLASLSPGQRAAAREPAPEIGAIRAAAAVNDQQGRLAPQRGDQSKPRSESRPESRGKPWVEPHADVGPGDERQGQPADGGRRLAAGAGAFLAQLLSQGGSWGGSDGLSAALLPGNRQAELGSEAYRRAGGEPPVYSEAPSLFRVAV